MRKSLFLSLVIADTLTGSAAISGLAGAQVGSRSGSYRTCNRIFDVPFLGNELASVTVVGDETKVLDLYIYDRSGRRVPWDEDLGGDCLTVWYPDYTKTYRIKMVDRGRVHNDRIETKGRNKRAESSKSCPDA